MNENLPVFRLKSYRNEQKCLEVSSFLRFVIGMYIAFTYQPPSNF